MVIDWTGRVTDEFSILGYPAQPMYLLDGPAPALFESGYTAMAAVFESAVRDALGGREPAYLFLTHSHFDHIGSASRLKRAWPELRIVASEGVRRVLARPSAVQTIRDLNVAAKERVAAMLRDGDCLNPDPFEPFEVDLTVVEGDRVRLSDDLSVLVLETPGHTRDMVSYYIPERKILIATEVAGIQDPTGYITSDFLVGYDAYRDSLLRLGHLDVEVLCQGHGLVFTGDDARDRLLRARDAAAGFVANAERLLTEERGDLERVAARIRAQEYDGKTGDMKLPEPAYLLNLQAKLKVVRERMEREAPPR